MAEVPTPEPSSEKIAPYPRGTDWRLYGSSKKLTKLFHGYRLLTWVIILIILGVIADLAGYQVILDSRSVGLVLVALAYVLPGAALILSIRASFDIGFGLGWHPAVSILVGLICPFTCLVGFVVMQQLAYKEFSRYGLNFGSNERATSEDVRRTIGELELRENQSSIGEIPSHQSFDL